MGEVINLVNNFKVEKELIKVLDKKKIEYYFCVTIQIGEYENKYDILFIGCGIYGFKK